MALPFHVFWDREQGLVALWSREQAGARTRPALYRVFLRTGGPQPEERFLGIFSNFTPAVRWVSAPWILLPVGDLDNFELRLETDSRRRDTGLVTMQFDAALRFDFERGNAPNERKVYLTYNEIWESAPDGSELISRRRIGVSDGQQPPQIDTMPRFVQWYVTMARSRNEEPLLMLASYVRGERFGPVTKIWPTQFSQVDVSCQVQDVEYMSRQQLDERRREEEESGRQAGSEMESSVFSYMLVDAKRYTQPSLVVSLGSSHEEAEHLQRAITFFHVKENVFAVERKRSEGDNAKGANRLKKLPERKADSRADVSVGYRAEPYRLIRGIDLALTEEGGRFHLRWPSNEVAMGDIVGLFVATETQLLLNGHDILSGTGQRQASAAKSMYFRFLADQLVPMPPEKLDSLYAKVSNDFSRQLQSIVSEGRFDPSERAEKPRLDASQYGAGSDASTRPPRNIAELFYDAWDHERQTLTPLKPRSRRQRDRRGLVEAIDDEQFARLPNLMHALLRTPKYRERVEGLIDWPQDVDTRPNFLLAALELAGASSQTKFWAEQALPDARQQAIAWDILAFGFEHINKCAEHNLRIPALRQGRFADLEGSVMVLRDQQRMQRTQKLLIDLGDRAEAGWLERTLGLVANRSSIELESLQRARQLSVSAENRLQEELDQAEELLGLWREHNQDKGGQEFQPSDFELEAADEGRKESLTREIEKALIDGIPPGEDRARALDQLAQLSTTAALRPLKIALGGSSFGQEVRSIVIRDARALIEWSARAGMHDEALRNSLEMPAPPAGSDRSPEDAARWWDKWWTDWCLALPAAPRLPADLTPANLAAGGSFGSDRTDIRSLLGPVAVGLTGLLRQSATQCRDNVKDSSQDVRRRMTADLEALEQLAEVAFATACARTMTATAHEIKSFVDAYNERRLPELIDSGAPMAETWKVLDDIDALWDKLGRCLAPENTLRLLPVAVATLQTLLDALQGLPGALHDRERTLPAFRLAPIAPAGARERAAY